MSGDEKDEPFVVQIRPAVFYLLLLAGFGGNATLTAFSTREEAVRPDPFTGEQGRQLERKVEALSQALQYHDEIFHEQLKRLMREFEARLSSCEKESHPKGHATE